MKRRAALGRSTTIVFVTISIVLILVLIAAAYGWLQPPPALCKTDACKEGREWIATLFTFVIILGGLYQYIQAQSWKRAEWVAAETASFFADPKVMNALRMLDWHGRVLPLLDDCEPFDKTFRFHSTMLATALYSASTIPTDPVTTHARKYLPHELAIRDCFDRMLDRLERFQIFVESGLVNTRELKPYLAYWVRLIGDAENNPYKPPAIVRRLWVYIEEYGFTRVQTLCASFGYVISPVDADRVRDPFPPALDLDEAEEPELLEEAGG